MRGTSFLLLLVSLLGCSGLRPIARPPQAESAGQAYQPIRRLSFLGEAVLESGLEFEGTTVGGLSALTYDSEREIFYALTDDPSFLHPSRLYGLEIDLAGDQLETGMVSITSLVVFRDKDGRELPTYTVDGEGLALTDSGSFFVASEGNIERGIQPSIREVAADGSPIRELALPEGYLSDGRGARGLRHNLAFEALTLTPEKTWLFAGIENALIQDGPEADLDQPSPGRILRYDLLGAQPPAEYLYWVAPVPEPSARPDGFKVNGLVELLALEGHQLLALERSFSAGVGNAARLYLVDLTHAEDIHGMDLHGRATDIRPAQKTLLLDLADLGIPLDNLEGLSHGPSLPDGRHTIFLISDDNFSSGQKSQLLAFAWSHQPVTLSQVQGAGHRSPYEGDWIFGVEGVVTALEPGTSPARAWIQYVEGDNDRSTSDGLLLETRGSPDFSVGDKLRVSGRVRESSWPGNLSVTYLKAASIEVLSSGSPLPPPSTLGAPIPWQIDNDELEAFEPWNDAVDYYESLEGMRVQVPSAVVVGSPSRFGDFTVLANNGGDLGPRTSAGGILLTAESGNSQRLQIDPRLVQSEDELFPGTGLDSLTVGSTFTGSLVGVLDYSFGAFEVVLTEPAAQAAVATLPADQTSLRGSSRELTVATFNVENLDALDSPAKYSKVAATIVEGLGAPDLLALQEVQDENGTIDDGTVSAAGTLGRLVDEIVSVGGPLYEYHQIDPENNADGGSPGANIRVAFLVNPQRLSVPLRGSPGAQTPTRIEILDGRVHLFPNPGRIAARDRAFSFDETLGYEASRKALALEVEFAGKRLFVVNLHLKSKRGDESLFGPVQPPGRRTEEQRLEQARSIRTFVEKLQKVEREAAIIVLGDLNDHEFRPPVRELEGEILANLVDEVPLTERYTYNFRGNSQVLDHILVSASIAEKASPEIDIVHVNADFPAAQRASDHDPVVIRLDLGNL